MAKKLLFVIVLVTVTMAIATDQRHGNDADVINMLKQMKEEIAMAKAKEEILREEVLNLKTENQAMRKEVADLKVKSDQRQMTVDTMFLATITAESTPIDDDEPIVFDGELINPGGHYNPVLGAYTAPVDGYYQFTATKKGNANTCSFYFLRDEIRYAENWHWLGDDSTETPACSVTINVQLTAGQVVRVQNEGSSAVYGIEDGYMTSFFTGHLLYAVE